MIFLLVLGVALSVGFQTLLYVFVPPRKDKELRRAFETLEEEFEDLRDNVRVALGRVSRLKRSIMSGEVPNPEEPPASTVEAADGEAGGFQLTPTQRTMQQRILSRRHKGVS